jgi:hypothetical protein
MLGPFRPGWREPYGLEPIVSERPSIFQFLIYIYIYIYICICIFGAS